MVPHTRSPEEYQEIGWSHYKHQRYNKAIDAFTKAIEASTIPAATLYDGRAACYDKLADFNSAIKDGRLTIRMHKQDARGYLRTASALQKQNKLDKALDIYKYGMKNIPAYNEGFKVLQQLHDRLTCKLSPPKAIDPLAVLPKELATMVFKQLSFRKIVQGIRVSKGWKNFITSNHELWVKIDLSDAKSVVSRSFLRNAVRYSEDQKRHKKLRTLVVHRMPHDDILRNIAAACPDLNTLTILSVSHMLSDTLIKVAQSAHNLKSITVHTKVGLDTMTQILRFRPGLEHVEFRDVAGARSPIVWNGGPFSLRDLTLRSSHCSPVFSDDVNALVRAAPELQSLTLVNLKTRRAMNHWEFEMTKLTTLIMRNVSSSIFPTFPTSLKRLEYSPRDRQEWSHRVKTLCARYLTDLTLSGETVLFPTVLYLFLDLAQVNEGDLSLEQEPTFYLVPNEAPLERLVLNGNLEWPSDMSRYRENAVPKAMLDRLANAPPNLRISTWLDTSRRVLTPALTTLALSGLPLTDDDITAIVERTDLSSVDVSNTLVSGLGIKRLVDGSPALRYIKADNCRNVSDRDAIEYAEKKGVYVSYSMGEPSGAKGAKGKKVRYG